MAQILKEDVRKSIIIAAKQEFLEKGYKGASMRSIASKANMTVGNLYRYYKNKEDINLSIVAPTFKLIETAMKSLNKDNVSLEPRVFNLKPNVNDVIKNYDSFAETLVNIYLRNKSEFNILILHSRVSEEMTNKFIEMVDNMISEIFVFEDLKIEKNVLVDAYGQSLFAGLKTIFKENNADAKKLCDLIKIYFRSFINMLDSDIGQYLEKNVINK